MGLFEKNKIKQPKPSKYEIKKQAQLDKVRNMFNSFNISKEYIDNRLGNVLIIDEENKQLGIFIDVVDYMGEKYSYHKDEQKYIIPFKNINELSFDTSSLIRTGFCDFELKSLGRDFVQEDVQTILGKISDNETIILKINHNMIWMYFTEVNEFKFCFELLLRYMEQAYEEKVHDEELREQQEFIDGFNED